ncbi:hypothetical protein EDB85DRAFT_2139670 [Lactarius pseudohatsudake]|nr:hypothetical protein EDB85DRAFT_2139670 [Lactarius pseudohatsudake]
MATTYKPLTADRIEDVTLGAFRNLRPSETLNHLIRYLERKLFMLIQYGAKVLIPILEARARLQRRAGVRTQPTSSIAPKLAKLASTIGSTPGMLPIIQWLIALERAPPPTRRLLTIERTQGWSISLSSPSSSSSSSARTTSSPPRSTSPPRPAAGPAASPSTTARSRCGQRASGWRTSCSSSRTSARTARCSSSANARSKLQPRERAGLARRWDAWYNELAVNLSYLPMTIRWSLEKGLFGNDIWVSLFGFAAAIASFRSGWKATALPPPPPPAEPSEDAPEVSDIALVTNDTDSSPQ